MTTGFELDTSGAVDTTLAPITIAGQALSSVAWTDLDDFTQAYVEALFNYEMESGNAFGGAVVGFANLSVPALASIVSDCAARALGYDTDGAAFLAARQAGTLWPVYPAVTPYIGDDGAVYLLAGA